jgi:hypothetical protein
MGDLVVDLAASIGRDDELLVDELVEDCPVDVDQVLGFDWSGGRSQVVPDRHQRREKWQGQPRARSATLATRRRS